MEFIPIKISQSHCNNNQTTVDDLIREYFRLRDDETSSSVVTFLENESTANLALLDFFKDIQHYKHELKGIKKAQESVAISKNVSGNSFADSATSVLSRDKYYLIQPENCIIEKTLSLNFHPTDDPPTKQLLQVLSESTISSSSVSKTRTRREPKTLASVKLTKSALKLKTLKRILLAQPEVIEFRNCEAHKTYQKKIILRNMDTQLARFRIESRPLRSPFTIFIENDRDLVAPGMQTKLIVEHKSDGLGEPEETLVINVANGQLVTITLRVRRDPPALQVLSQTCTILSLVEQPSKSCSTSSSITESTSRDSLSGSLTGSEWTSIRSMDYRGKKSTFDCKKCFVGEFVVISTLIRNDGGRARFFIMSETDWCLLKIKDITANNMLIVPPFAMWPAYFALDPADVLILYTYFFPQSSGLQVDELYVVSDNCSVRSIEVVGDGIVFERQSLEFNDNVKYQWFQMKNKELCMMRYIDLGVGESNSLLGGTFAITSKCDLDVHYRWEVSDIVLCPSIYKITIGLGKTNFPVGKISVQPSSGLFQANSVVTFRLIADLSSVQHDRYRTTLRLIIEDLPRAAIPDRFNFPCKQSQTKRRLCENPVDINFEDIDVRFKCESVVEFDSETSEQSTGTDDSMTERTLQTISMTDIAHVAEDDSLFWQSAFIFKPELMDDGQSSTSEQVCRFIQGLGTCDCCRASLVSTAVLRPGSPLFVGIASKYAILLCNRTSAKIKYWWSQPVGPDHRKIKISFEPPYNCIAPKSCQVIHLKCLPLESGMISSLFISCQFNARNPIVLSIECIVKSLCVTFYFPAPTTERSDVSYAHIEWNANEYLSKYDKKSGKIQLLLMMPGEEKTLHVDDLNSVQSSEEANDQADLSDQHEYEGQKVLGDFSSCDASVVGDNDKYHGEVKTDSARVSRDFLQESLEYEAESFVDESEYLQLLPYVDWYSTLIKKCFRYQPLVYEIHVHSHKTTEKRIYIQNDSPISSNFHIYMKNYWARHSLPDGQSALLLDCNESQSGIKLKIEPVRGQINPRETLHFDLIINSTTWGVYTDQITVEIDYLPPLTFWIRVINDDSPITYPVCKNTSIAIPSIRFTSFKPGYPLEQRRVLLENVSDVPLYINWHCFLTSGADDQAETEPFNVVLDMVTPQLDINELLLTDSTFMHAVERYIKCMYDRYETKDDLAEIDEILGKDPSSSDSSFKISKGKDSRLRESRSNAAGDSVGSSSDADSESVITPTLQKPTNKPKDTEFRISLLPYYGKLTSDLFIITPSEVFLPPKSKHYININVNTAKLNEHVGGVRCKACGLIRIPPVYKYKDNTYHRKEGHYMPPMEIDLSCDLRRPKFFMQADKSQLTFEFHTKDFVQRATDKLRVKRKITFNNFDVKAMNVKYKIDKPFSIKSIAIGEVICGNSVTVRPSQNAQVVIKCSIDDNWIKEAINEHEDDYRHDNSVTLSHRLKINYKEGFCQYHELYTRIIFPSLAISTTHLDFGNVLFGERKSLQFEIRNLSKAAQTCQLQRTEKVEYFTLYPVEVLLAKRNLLDMDRLKVTASFVPLNSGIFKETVKVISEVDGLVFYCTLEGSSCA